MFLKLRPSYIKTEEQQDAFVAMMFYICCSFSFFLYEQTLIPNDVFMLYLASKIILIFGAIPIFYGLCKSPYNYQLQSPLAIMLTLFSVVGECFSPLYFFAFIAISMGLILFYRFRPRHLFPILFIGGLCLLTIQYSKNFGYFKFARNVDIGDYVIIYVEYMLMLIYLFNGYSKSRRNEIQFRERFSLIGKDLNIFAHNIKSLMSSQLILNDNIKENIEDHTLLNELILKSENNLDEIYSYLNEFNLLSHTDYQQVDFKKVILKVCKLLGIPNKSIHLVTHETFNIIACTQDIESIMISILSNAKKSLAASPKDLKINIDVFHDHISFTSRFIQDFPKSSSIGDKITDQLATKNALLIERDVIKKEEIPVEYNVTLKLKH
jgi:hypothetical protein